MHPLTGDLSQLKDAELEAKISDLTKKYFLAYDTNMKNQIAGLLDDYNREIGTRRELALKKLMNSRDKRLDNLVKVN